MRGDQAPLFQIPKAEDKEPIMNLLHTFQSRVSLNHAFFHRSEALEHLDLVPDQDKEVNIITGVKHLNNKKIDSHLYFFRGFCEYLKPKHVLLLDAGTKPQKGSINKLYALMESQDDIGGACGDLGVELQMDKDGSWILNYA